MSWTDDRYAAVMQAQKQSGTPLSGALWGIDRAGALLPSSGSPLDAFVNAAGQSALINAGTSIGDTPLWETGKPAYESFREVVGGFNPQFASDDELTSLFLSAKDPSLAGQFGTLMAERQNQRAIEQNAYAQQLGGNYAGGNLPSSGYAPPAQTAPTSWGSSWSQPQQSVGGLGGMANGVGGLGGWGGPFSNRNPWGAS